MDPITGGLALGGASLLGGILTNQANQANVQKQMDFQADQSATAYQRQKADMEKAGLNPMFAVGSGGASSGTGGAATAVNPVTPALSSAMQGLQTMQGQRQTDADVALKAAQVMSQSAQADQAKASTGQSLEDTKLKKLQESEYESRSNMFKMLNQGIQKSGQGWNLIFDLLNGHQQPNALK